MQINPDSALIALAHLAVPDDLEPPIPLTHPAPKPTFVEGDLWPGDVTDSELSNTDFQRIGVDRYKVDDAEVDHTGVNGSKVNDSNPP